ncbi:uncharacterized protein LOC114754016 isoform X2 [Neltuma alba]|uniref:uncharacterized protein LOC114718089 isoform X2 n=1 Tax=Neltuma alba TaxID=207710 RepID=UPI0010A3F964|nr:uncharacterized protein LOC114718089 isoform X2 [Prosopis alba]XP_028798574.1 uncharacterized protein LOC114754016 isoform X2 [Prosopis alba]
MDESWRMRMGLMPGLPRRRSMEDRSSSRSRRSIFSGGGSGCESENLDPEDFADVFGGPPRSLLAHKFPRSSSFYEEIFRPPEFLSPASKGGRNLPVFRIPTKNEGFYSDIFGSDDDRKSRERSGSHSKAKSNSSSVLSSEELSPARPAIGDDVALSVFASKLRWNSFTTMPEEHLNKEGRPIFPSNSQLFEVQYQDHEYKDNFRSSHLGFSKRVSSPETISLETNSYQTIKVSVDDWELNSPFSAVSSLCQESELAKSAVQHHVHPEQIIEQDFDDDDDDEVMSSYVIEVNPSLKEEDSGSTAIDEAIAWAKEKFQTRSSDEDSNMRNNGDERGAGTKGDQPDASDYHDEATATIQSLKKPQVETEKLDGDIRSWSSGKETDIRLLLSTLHYILWPESGWCAIPLMNLIESSQVKKAYQKARLCLHPDKLQQRGATQKHKYIAEKAFSILQDAWAAFVSEDVSF